MSAPRNRTLVITEEEQLRLRPSLLHLSHEGALPDHGIVLAESPEAYALLEPQSVDLVVADPPYNMAKTFGTRKARSMSEQEYGDWLRSWLAPLLPLLKESASLYFCTEWRSSGTAQAVLSEFFTVRNRITWEREKGRAAQDNWKNCSEDIWYCTMGDNFYFDPVSVRLRRRVLAPYKDAEGQPKDWTEGTDSKYRDTAPSNLWTDLSVPFWSMPENTEHPTQKPEKLLAKLLLASSKPGDLVFDPFAGSGTTLAVARKLGRRSLGIEREETYALLAARRLELAAENTRIQGYADGVFWERNSQK